MMIVSLFFLLILKGGNTSTLELQDDAQLMPNETMTRDKKVEIDELCIFLAVANHLNLTKDNNKYTMSRPVRHHTHPLTVVLEMKIYAILDMREIDQTLISYIWVSLKWKNEYIWWDPYQFCGLKYITVPTGYLWIPDITIEEMTEKDKATPSPYLSISSAGWVEFRNDQVVLSTCKMHVYKFPFDIQSCNLSFKSILHTDEDIQLHYQENNTLITRLSREVMHTQYEWLFINMIVTNKTNRLNFNQTSVVYTITMKRRSILYIVNFILPVLFFLCLDLASFLISDTGGEKLSFKVTVLLAVTVMQLILNDILPCSSNKVPLIAVYCIGIFALMLLSLLETILVMHLIEKDSAAQDNETSRDQSTDVNCGDKSNPHRNLEISDSHCASVCDAPAEEMQSVIKEGSSSKLTDVSFAVEKVSDEPGATEKPMNRLSSNKKEEMKSGYWTRVVKIINRAFLIFYVSAVTLFLGVMFIMWNSSEDDDG